MEKFDAPVLFHHDESMPPVEPGTFGFGGAWTRRSVLLGGAGAGLAALLAACGGDNKKSSPTTIAAATTAAPATTAGGGSSSSAGGSASSATTAAPARTEGKTQTVTIGVPSLEEAFVDPQWAVGGLIFPLMWAITDFLYMQDQDGKFVPTLATGYDLSSDGLTWTFKLRDGVKNHDGSLFTANDVKTAVDRVTTGPQAAQFTHLANFKSYVTGATVVDPLTVQIVTGKPFATLVVDMTPPIASDYYNKVGDAAFKAHPICTGPWKFVSQELNANVKYDRHDDYWDATRKPNWPHLTYAIVPDESSLVAGVKTGTLDIAYGLSASSADGVKGQNGVQISEIQSTGLGYCMMYDNNFPDQPSPLKDANVRKALLMAVDRDSIAKTLYKGYAKTPTSNWPIICPGFNPDTKAVPYDANGAKQLLAQAGQSNLSLTLSTYASTSTVPDIQKLGETVIAYWGQIGVKATLNAVDSGTYLTQFRNKQLHGACLISGPTAFYVEPTRLLAQSFFWTKAPYTTIVGDQKIDDWVDQLNKELDADKRAAIGRQAADYLDQQLYGLPMILTSSLVAVGPNIASFGYVKANPYAGPTSWIIAK
jgi:peptide/nickel transport system substrate-binding protein